MDEQRVVVGGVDTHKDLHFAAVVDGQDRVLGNECFPSTRHGYKRMLTWFQSFGELARIGVECTGTYGAGLLRYLQHAGVTVLEVTAPDKHDRRKRGKEQQTSVFWTGAGRWPTLAAHPALKVHKRSPPNLFQKRQCSMGSWANSHQEKREKSGAKPIRPGRFSLNPVFRSVASSR